MEPVPEDVRTTTDRRLSRLPRLTAGDFTGRSAPEAGALDACAGNEPRSHGTQLDRRLVRRHAQAVMRMRSQPITFAALLLACVLLPGSFFLHSHDEDDEHNGHHHCVVCCHQHHPGLAAGVKTPASDMGDTARAVFATNRRIHSSAALGVQLTRGPPA